MPGPRDGLPVLVNGVRYETDVESIGWRTVPPTRQGSDQGAGPGEQSLSMENIWRRSRENWIAGAGQEHTDLIDESNPLRFDTSWGIDPWTPRALSPLPTVEQKLTTILNNPRCIAMTVASVEYLVVLDGTTVKYTSNPQDSPPTWTSHTGLGINIKDSLTTDGERWWTCNQIQVDTGVPGTAAATLFSTYDAHLVGYASGRLLAAAGNELVELDSTGAPIILYTHPNSSFYWRGISPSPAGIYVWGTVGQRSEVYVLTAIDSTGALDVPFSACETPDGELIHAMTSYAGVMVLGTSRGIRLGLLQGGGFLSIGPVIEEPGEVTCLEPQLEDVWFGWSSMATPSPNVGGLGRIRLSRFTAELVPAFASDLAVSSPSSTRVTSVCTVGGRRYFGIDAAGYYGEMTSLVPSSTIDLGFFTYGISEEKILDTITVWCDELPTGCSIVANVYNDDETTPLITMTMNTVGQRKETMAYTGTVNCERVRVTLTLTQVGGTPIVVRRVTLRASPKAFVSQIITLPLFLTDEVVASSGHRIGMDPYQEFLALETLLKNRSRFTLGVGEWSASVRLEALEVEKGGLGGGNGLEGWADLRKFVGGRWDCTFVTQEETGVT